MFISGKKISLYQVKKIISLYQVTKKFILDKKNKTFIPGIKIKCLYQVIKKNHTKNKDLCQVKRLSLGSNQVTKIKR